MKYKIVASVLIGLILLGTSCSKVQSCAELTQEYRVQVDKLASGWDNANEIASNTPRMQLTEPITNLQNIRNDYKDLSVPTCARKAHALLLEYMDTIINAYTSYSTYKPDSTVNDLFTRASQDFDSWKVAYSKLSATPTP